MEKNSFVPIADGVLRSIITTAFLLVIYAIAMSFIEMSIKMNSIFILVTTILSIMYGTIYAVKKTNKRGWLTGIIIALLYVGIIYIISILAGNSPELYSSRIIRLGLALIVGALSGMIGINL